MSEHPQAGAPSEGVGILFAGSAYVAWGILPLYWHLLDGIPPFQVTAYRVVFSVLFVAGVTLARGRWSRLMSLTTTPHVLRNLVVSAVLIACNWTTFIYAVSTNQLVEASLGYYILPLISIVLGIVLFAERLSRLRLAALALAAVAVAVQAAALGHLPWIALIVALSFGFYGYVRKLTPVDPLDGLMVETLVLLPLAIGLIGYWTSTGEAALTAATPRPDLLLAGTGPLTVIPLSLFAAGARRIRLSTLGFLQYLAPSITLLLAIALYGEPFRRLDAVTFGCVWTALAIVAAEGQLRRWRLRRDPR